jgi:hypothetical protein
MKYLLLCFLMLLFSCGLYAQTHFSATLYFDFDKDVLRKEAVDTLEKLVKKIPEKDFKDINIRIAGHTDWMGSDAYNMDLGERRAASIRDFIISKGILKDHISYVSKGESQPAATNTSAEGRQKNRRVRVDFYLSIQSASLVMNGSIPKEQNTSSLNHRPSLVKLNSYSTNKQFSSGNKTGDSNWASAPDTTAIVPPVPPRDFCNRLIPPDRADEKDTIIRGPKGGLVRIKGGAFKPYRLRDIKFELTEVYSRGDIIRTGASVMDTNGNCLASGGMLFIKATVNAAEVQPSRGCMVNIGIPSPKNDPEMRIYAMNDLTPGKNWGKTETDIKYDSGYYNFNAGSMGGFNCDKIKSPVTRAVVASLMSIFQRDPSFVWIKARRYTLRHNHHYENKYFLSGQQEMTMLKGQKVKFYMTKYGACNAGGSMVIATFCKDNKLYYVNKPLASLKYRWLTNTYTIRKKDYVVVTEEQLAAELDKL